LCKAQRLPGSPGAAVPLEPVRGLLRELLELLHEELEQFRVLARLATG
jgi:hypothetical protein